MFYTKKIIIIITKLPTLNPLLSSRNREKSSYVFSFFTFLMMLHEMIYLLVITTCFYKYIYSRHRRRLCTCLFLYNKLHDWLCVSDVDAMIHHQKQQSIRVPMSICDLSENILTSGIQFPGESKTKKIYIFLLIKLRKIPPVEEMSPMTLKTILMRYDNIKPSRVKLILKVVQK